MQDEILIFGCGGHAKVVIEAAREQFPTAMLAIADDAFTPGSAPLLGLPIGGDRTWVEQRRPVGGVVPAVGNNKDRSALLAWLREKDLRLRTIIHPRAVVSPSVRVGGGVFVAAGAVVNSESELSDGVIVNTCASVDHDCQIGAGAHVAPGAHLCGNVRIGSRSLVGAGATVIPGVRVGEDVMIAAGSTVISDIPDRARVAGCPARPF